MIRKFHKSQNKHILKILCCDEIAELSDAAVKRIIDTEDLEPTEIMLEWSAAKTANYKVHNRHGWRESMTQWLNFYATFGIDGPAYL